MDRLCDRIAGAKTSSEREIHRVSHRERLLMDFADFAVVQKDLDAGVTVHVTDTNGELQYYGADNKPVTITVGAKWSSTYNRALFAQRKAGRARNPNSPEEVLARAVDFLAECVIDWEGFTVGSEPFLFNKANVISLLTAAP